VKAVARVRLALPLATAALVGAVLAGACSDPAPTNYPSRAELLDPASCKRCHEQHYTDWSSSMHAYAGDDPVFLAMNARGQRETGGALGSFCVNCHAPMAVHEKATTDGLNLASVPQKLKGVTCYFCHDIDAIQGSHNGAVHLANGVTMRGPISDPLANEAHPSAHSVLHDRDHLDSSSLCGSCHDVQNGHGASIERTMAEWQATVFSQPTIGNTCGQCHMDQSTSPVPVAQSDGAKPRRYHSHLLAGVDLPLIPFPGKDQQQARVQSLLDSSLQSGLCVALFGFGVDVILDNVAAGHGLPSGAAQDRRMWTEIVAEKNGSVVYQSGVVAADQAVGKAPDPDLWVLRDCMLDDQEKPVSMFWEAFDHESTQLPGPVTLDPLDQRFYQTHVFRSFPRTPGTLTDPPDKVTLRIHMRAIDFDLVDDLVASGDLDPSVRASLTTFDVGKPLVWTAADAKPTYQRNGIQYACVTNTNLNLVADKYPAPEAPHCAP
jgi:hypothetical protein